MCFAISICFLRFSNTFAISIFISRFLNVFCDFMLSFAIFKYVCDLHFHFVIFKCVLQFHVAFCDFHMRYAISICTRFTILFSQNSVSCDVSFPVSKNPCRKLLSKMRAYQDALGEEFLNSFCHLKLCKQSFRIKVPIQVPF